MDNYHIIGIYVDDRLTNAVDLQKIFTEYGCYVKTRLGLHKTSDTSCSPTGLLILELFGDKNKRTELITKLNNLKHTTVKEMIF